MGDPEQLEVPESKRRLMLGGGAVGGMIDGLAIMVGVGFLPFQRERPDRRLKPLPRIQRREPSERLEEAVHDRR